MDWFDRAVTGRVGLSALCGLTFVAVCQTLGYITAFVFEHSRSWQDDVALGVAFGLWSFLRYPVWRNKGELDGILAAARQTE